MAHDLIQIGAEPLRVNCWRCPEEGDCSLGGDEAVAAQWSELAHGNAVARDDERLALVELAHNLTAVVAQFSLGDLSAHGRIVARVLQKGLSPETKAAGPVQPPSNAGGEARFSFL